MKLAPRLLAPSHVLLVTLLSIGAVAPSAARAEPRVPVEATGCGELDAAGLANLLDLELSDMVGTWEDIDAPPVELECTGEAIVIAVQDPITGKRLQRSIPRPDGPLAGRERALALAISQLFVTSWLELLLPAAERRFAMPEQSPEHLEAATRRAREAVEPTVGRPPPEPAPSAGSGVRLLLSAGGGARLRDLSAPLLTAHGSVRGGLGLSGRFRVFAEAGLEHGSASRARGDVETWIGAFGIGASWLSSPDTLAVTASAVVSALYVRLRGEPNDPLVVGATTQSVASQLVVEAGPVLTLDPIRLELVLCGGLTLFAPEGAVSGENAVQPGGAFVGATFRTDLEFR